MKNEYYLQKETVKEYIKMAEGVDSQALIVEFTKHLPEHARVLELGTGPGTDYLLLKEKFEVTSSDFSSEFLNHLKHSFPDDNFLQLDASTLETDLVFDGIYSNKVLQHLSNDELKSSVLQQTKKLTRGGIICHSFWKGEGDEIFKGMFVNYQNQSSLESLFSPYFKILKLEEYKEFDANDSIFLIAEKL